MGNSEKNRNIKSRSRPPERPVRVTVRMSESEAETLKGAAEAAHLSQADFIRIRTTAPEKARLPQELKNLLHGMDRDIGEMSGSVNSLVHAARTTGKVSDETFKAVLTQLVCLRDVCDRVYRKLMEGDYDGNHEADPD